MSRLGWTLVTGATGFIGQNVLAELLRRGVRCIALTRSGDLAEIESLLQNPDREGGAVHDPDHAATSAAPPLRSGFGNAGLLRAARGCLPDVLPALGDCEIRRVVHVAGKTQFVETDGEPHRTNVEGTRRLLEWMDRRAIRDLTHVSTAYVCGRGRQTVFERFEPAPPAFHNDYEQSKWEAERLVTEWAESAGRRLVIVRPSIVAGHFQTGAATEFRGIYGVARAVEQLSRSLDGQPWGARQNVALRLRGHADAPNAIVPVDFVAAAIAALALDPAADGVYHLAHPKPPTNGEIKRWLEMYFEVGGGRFVGEPEIASNSMSEVERAFYGGVSPLAEYFSDSPQFDCARATSALVRQSVQCPALDFAYLKRCIDFARARNWRRLKKRVSHADSFDSAYFERFLPHFLPQSLVSRIRPLRATIRFEIEDRAWLCAFADGRLESVTRGGDGPAQFGYRTSMYGFWRAISGQVEGQELFSNGEADVFGDVEAALKMSVILHQFAREFPCDRARLQRFVEWG